MISDSDYELCLPTLQDAAVDEDDKPEKLEEVLKEKTSLTGKSLEAAILDALWRFRSAASTAASPPPSRHTVIRRASPAPWQINRAPTPVSSPRPAPPPGFGVAPPSFNRSKSYTASPFSSPKPSPRLAYATPHIPGSPSLKGYEFSDASSPTNETYGDYGSDTVDWLVNEDGTSTDASSMTGDGVNGKASEWVQPAMIEMSPYDMLRSILRDERSDDEIEQALAANAYDFSATVMSLMGAEGLELPQAAEAEQERTVTIGKPMSPAFRPATPLGQAKSNIMCKYWLSTGNCARADCRFSHDPSTTLCKYWMSGNCLAGEACIFSHDPSALMAQVSLEQGTETPPIEHLQPAFQVQDFDSFPSLQAMANQQQLQMQLQQSLEQSSGDRSFRPGGAVTAPPGLNPLANFVPSQPTSRPSSRHNSRAPTPSIPGADDSEAFPSLGSGIKLGKKHHGKRGGHGHSNRESSGPASIADVVRMSPSPAPAQLRKGLKPTRSFNGTRENSTAAQAIPAPDHIPWLETGEKANQAYLKARQKAFQHGALRNKFLQSAAQAWNRNDARAAKALSLRGQNENSHMREAHREAARLLYEERNKENGPNSRELYVDLHGLHPEEAVSYLETILLRHQSSSRPIYAITGTGHHSKNGKDKVGKAIRGFLNEWRYAFREFSVPGDRGNVGGILGIDPSSYDRNVGERKAEEEANGAGADVSDGFVGGGSKIRIIRAEDMNNVPRGPRATRNMSPRPGSRPTTPRMRSATPGLGS